MTTSPPPPEAQIIGERRRRTGKSMRQLALEAGISPTWWRDIEKGTRRAGAESMASIARVLWMTPQDLEDTGRGDAVDELLRQLKTGPKDVTVDEVRTMAERIARVRGMDESQKRYLAEKFFEVIEGAEGQEQQE